MSPPLGHYFFYLLLLKKVIQLISKENTRIKVTISKTLLLKLKDIASYEGKSVSNLAANVLKQYVDEYKDSKEK